MIKNFLTKHIDILLYKGNPLGRRQVVRHLVLVQAFQRFESFRPRILKKSSLELFFNVLLGAMDENRGSNRARELRLESFAKDKVLKQNLELPLNATEQDTFAPVLLRESPKRLSLIIFQSSSIEN